MFPLENSIDVLFIYLVFSPPTNRTENNEEGDTERFLKLENQS